MFNKIINSCVIGLSMIDLSMGQLPFQKPVGTYNITNEISMTSGYAFNNKNSIKAISGKNKYTFDIVRENFAWITDSKFEKRMIKTMQKGSRIMVKAHNLKGSQTIDHYSLLGFTKAYKATKANCS